jgi:pantetheine-phosphate adenylyltransferase
MKAVYPGSFDPITLGHVDIIKRICSKFSEVHLAISESLDKSYMFTPQEREAMIKASLPNIDNLYFHINSGLTIDFAKSIGANIIVRGLRVVSDFEYEMVMANMNKKLNSEIETLIVFANPEFNFVSSRLVKEVAKHKGNLLGLVPPAVEIAIQNKVAQ